MNEQTTRSPHGDVRNAGAYGVDAAGDLVAEHSGRREGDVALKDVQVSVADATGGDLHPQLVLVGFRMTSSSTVMGWLG